MKHKLNTLHIICLAVAAIAVVALSACIKNDIPYPRIQANFLTFNTVGQDRGTAIDSITRTIKLYYGEEIDIENIEVESYTLTPGAEIAGDPLPQKINLSRPMVVWLRLYQNWEWTIEAVQNIERYFEVSGQVGSSFIDVPGRRVIVYVSDKTSLSKIYVERAKLGPIGSVTTPTLEGKTIDLSRPLEVDIEAYGRIQRWTIFAEQVETTLSTERVDAWTNVAWLYGVGESTAQNTFEYRIKGDTQWTRLPLSEITTSGGSFSARLIHLSAMTTYEARAVSDTEQGQVIEFTTGSAVQMPNSSLDEWWLNGKIWNPWPEGGTPYWDTGNKGATTLGASNSTPTDDTSTGTGWAARLESRFVGIGSLGKLAAGNLFVGEYYRTDGTNGILHFGRPFTERPTKLRGYLKYTSVPIDRSDEQWRPLIGQPDTCIVWCALIDLDEPFEIRTKPADRQLFDPDGSYVIAYGKVQYGETISEYIPFEFELEYKSTQRVPKFILVTASASKYGDYFTGGSGSVLYLDDLQLEYDY